MKGSDKESMGGTLPPRMPVRRVRILTVLVTALVLLAAPAFADDGEDEVVEPPSWRTLLERVSDAIAAVHPSSPGDPTQEDVPDGASGAALLAGEVRVAAAERVRWLHPELRLSVHDLVVGGSGLLYEVAEHHGPVTRWDLERTARRWAAVEARLDEFRGLVADRVPERLCPVSGPVDFENDWHDDRPGGRAHKGNDLHGERGAPLLAIEAGTVVQANWHRAGGRQIYVTADSTGDVYYYSHLESWAEWIWTGTRVEVGDEIGTLGRSGNAHTPHLHFGWMPGSMTIDLENLQNPYPLLVELCVP
jgi:hypothetical protein